MNFISTAYAQAGIAAPTVTDLQALSLTDAVYMLAALAILGAGALSIIFIFYGGFSFILSGGDEGKVKEAIHTIRYAIIGLIIALLSLVIVPVIGKLFGVNFNFLDFATLSDQINNIFGQFQQSAPAAPADSSTSGAASTVQPATPRPATPGVTVNELIR